MFGQFDQNFGIPAIDIQGGYFGNTAPAPDSGVAAEPGSGAALTLPGGPTSTGGAPAAGLPDAAPPALGAPSPLGGGPLAPGGGATPTPAMPESAPAAPAAGLGSPFGKVGV